MLGRTRRARTALDGRKRQTMTLAIGFRTRRAKAEQRARKSLRAGFAAKAARYHAGWEGYVDSLADPPAPVASDPALMALYEQSLMILAASEDKKFRGASIAAGEPIERPAIVACRYTGQEC